MHRFQRLVLRTLLVQMSKTIAVMSLVLVLSGSCFAFLGAVEHGDARDYGVPTYWLVFGFIAQSIFMGRMLLLWFVSERKKESVIPVAFWWLSLVGGLMLCVYFLRRGDPVGISGQLFGIVIYMRNLVLIYRKRHHAV